MASQWEVIKGIIAADLWVGEGGKLVSNVIALAIGGEWKNDHMHT